MFTDWMFNQNANGLFIRKRMILSKKRGEEECLDLWCASKFANTFSHLNSKRDLPSILALSFEHAHVNISSNSNPKARIRMGKIFGFQKCTNTSTEWEGWNTIMWECVRVCVFGFKLWFNNFRKYVNDLI